MLAKLFSDNKNTCLNFVTVLSSLAAAGNLRIYNFKVMALNLFISILSSEELLKRSLWTFLGDRGWWGYKNPLCSLDTISPPPFFSPSFPLFKRSIDLLWIWTLGESLETSWELHTTATLRKGLKLCAEMRIIQLSFSQISQMN